jgi:two-component system OmpR family response regulator
VDGVGTYPPDAHHEAKAQVLLIDDEPTILDLVSRVLLGHGFSVDSALDGGRGLSMVRNRAYGLVVLDLTMPGVDGIATLKGIMAARPSQAVMVLSGRSDLESKVLCLELGAADYLTKPFSMAELLARVRTRLRQSVTSGSERFIRVGSVTLDLQRHAADAGAGCTSCTAPARSARASSCWPRSGTRRSTRAPT